MLFTTLTDIVVDPVPLSSYNIRVEWRYESEPGNWRIASYSAAVFPSGILVSPIYIYYDEAIDTSIQIKATVLGCSSAQSYYYDYTGSSVSTTTTTTSTTTIPIISGTVEAVPYQGDTTGGPVHLILTFTSPTPIPLHFRWGYDYKRTSGIVTDHSVTYPPALSYVDGGCIPYNWIDSRMDKTIPTGTSSIQFDHFCQGEINHNFGYISKIVFYYLSAGGYSLTLTPTRMSLGFEIR